MAKNTNKKLDINKILIGGLILVIAAIMVFRSLTAQKGKIAMVQFDDVDYYYEITLEKEDTYTITEGNFVVTLDVKDGRIRFINSVCPDHLCEGFGYISNEDDFAICMPAGVAVLIVD